MSEDTPARKRGFAAMSPERLKSISRKGGLHAHAKGSAHQFTSHEARQAGKRGLSMRYKGSVTSREAETDI